MTGLPTSDDLLRRRQLEQAELDRPRERAIAAERDRLAARSQCWDMLEQFVTRAGELGVKHRRWESSVRLVHTPRIIWVEGFPLTNGGVVSAPPHQYCVAERRSVRRPRLEVREVGELSMFLPAVTQTEEDGELFEQHTPTEGAWPRIDRLEYALTILDALRAELEKSLLTLMG